MEKKRVIINFADRAGWYMNGQRRLIEETPKYFSGELITINEYSQIGSPTHHENPYAFKVFCIEYALSKGFTTILFVDSSIVPVKNIDPVFDYIEQNGHLMQLCGHPVDNWCNQSCRDYFSLSREESKGMPMFSAGFTGLDFTNERSVKFFDEWKKAALGGAFKGSWSDHRHDMTAGSIIANRLKMNFESYPWFCYIGSGYTPPTEKSFFYCQPC